MRQPEWNDFRVLLALHRGNSVVGAARILGVNASTVSRRLAALEESLGATLVVRGGREFSFTAEGRTALAAAEAMGAAVTAAGGSVRASRAGIDGVVRVSVAPSLHEFLGPVPELVAAAHPGLSVELRSGRAVEDLARGDADIAIRTNRRLPADLVVRHAFDLGLGVYASTRYLERAGRPASAEDLRRHRLILYTAEFHDQPFAAWIAQYATPGIPSTTVDNVEMARRLIGAGEGVGVLYCCHADALPDLERVLPEPVARTAMCLVYHRSLRGSARVAAVAGILVGRIAAHREELAGRRPAG
jgi:DNA-binding transcriptional LysR family regulator